MKFVIVLYLGFSLIFVMLSRITPEDAPPLVGDGGLASVAAVYTAVVGLLWYRAGLRHQQLLASSSTLLEGIPIGVSIIDENLRFQYVNPALARSLGRKRRAIVNRPVADFVAPEDRETVSAEQARRRAGETSSYRVRLLRADKEPFEAIITAIPFQKAGQFDGVFAFVNDVSDYVRAVEGAAHFRQLSSFLMDAVTHDLSNSIQGVLGRAELASHIAEGHHDERLSRSLLQIAESAALSSTLIREIKQIALVEDGARPRRLQALGTIIDRAIELANLPDMAYVDPELSLAEHNLKLAANELAPMAIAKILEEAAAVAP